jgi:hypothetical protein
VTTGQTKKPAVMRYFAGFVVAVAIAAAAGPALAADGRQFRCTNPASGASWRITVDFARHRVDTYPAKIDPHWISWHDTAQGGFYDLDRKTGVLTMRNASSTGGYFLHDTCHPD